MKKTLFLTLLILFTASSSLMFGQLSGGKPIAEIFTDFHYVLSGSGSSTSGFGLTRAYFGYNYAFDEKFSSIIMINLGSPDDLGAGSKSRRYAFLREVSISYKAGNLNLSMGMIGTRLYTFQQKFWGKRYVADTYQSLNGYGFVADLGIAADYKINDFISVDFTFMNGEGYSSLQLDNNLKPSFGITITPIKQIAIRLYSDFLRKDGLWQNTYIGFAGFKSENLYIGGEISYKSHLELVNGHHAWGFSSTAGISLTKKTEFFTRYDYSTSVIVPGDAVEWNYQKDGSFLVAGIQHTFNSSVKIALDYQSYYPVDLNKSITDIIFINALFKF